MPELPVLVFAPNLGGLLSLLVTILLPLAVGVVTTRLTSSAAKALILLAFSAVKVVVESAIAAEAAGVPWAFVPVVMNVLINFGVACAIHFGFWKPTGVSDNVINGVGRTTQVVGR